MTGIIDVRVRVEEKHRGRLTMDLARHIPYAKIVGEEIVVISDNNNKNEQKLLSPPKKKWKWKSKNAEFSPQQAAVLEAIKAGNQDMIAIRDAAGMNELRGTSKVINNLKRLKYIKGVNGTYKLTKTNESNSDEE